MAALAVDSKVNWAGLGPRQTKVYQIKNGVQLYVGSLLQLTSGNADAYVSGGGATNPCIGVAVQGGIPGSNPVTDGFTLTSLPIPMIGPGNVSTAAAGNANLVVVEQGAFTWNQVAITLSGTSLTGVQADVGTKVFATTSNISNLVTTNPGTDKVFGEVTKFYSATSTVGTYDIFVNSYDARTRGN